MTTLRVATASVKVPVSPRMVLGGGIEPLFSKRQEGKIRASAVVVEADTRLCIVSCDVLALTRDICDTAAHTIQEQCHIPFQNVMICATHTHHAPATVTVHGYSREEKFVADIQTAIIRAACDATCLLEATPSPNDAEAELLLASGWEGTVGRNSRFLLRDGTIAWYGYTPEEILRPTGPFDPEMPIVAFRRPTSRLAAVLFLHANHNIGFQKVACSPGIYGLAAQDAERRHGTTFLYLPGAIGSSHPTNLSVDECLYRIGNALDRGLTDLHPALFGPVHCRKIPFEFRIRHFDEAAEDAAVRSWCSKWFDCEKARRYTEVFRRMRAILASRQGEKLETWLQVIRLGEIVFLGVPGELFASLAMSIKRLSPFRHTIIVCLANDEIGYIPDVEAMELGGYQVWTGFHSVLEKGAGEALAEACLELLNSLAAEPASQPEIRTISEKDALDLQKFYNSLDREAKTLFRPLGWNASLGACQTVVHDALAGKRFDFVADCGRIVGWAFAASIERDYPTFGIGVSSEYRHQGLGTALAKCVIQKVRSRGNKGLCLTVVKSNLFAKRLYERVGFKLTGERIGSDGLEYYEMHLDF